MKNNDGMTLVEVLVSLAIVFIVFLGLNAGGLLVLDQNIKNTQRDEGVSVAELEMQRVRNTPFASLANDNTTVPRIVRGVSKNYTVQRTVTILDAQNREVVVDVRWDRVENGQTRTYNHLVRTIVRAR